MRILVFRFSALGDVALTIPVLQKFIQKYPDAEVTFVSRPFLKPLFKPLNINFFGADLNGKHKGFFGLHRLYRELNKEVKPDLVIDLHQVLRTSILNFFFKSSGVPIFKIDKDRSAKKLLTRRDNKVFKALAHTTERYSKVFEKAGLPIQFNTTDSISLSYEKIEKDIKLENTNGLIGIAPLAFHKGKSWPLEKMKQLISSLVLDGNMVVLFGGPNEAKVLDDLREKESKIINLAGKMDLASEIHLMQRLDLMIAMDSSNMHLATLAGIPVVSIWGATHSYAGFGPLGDNSDHKIELTREQLDCRPCSVFGNKECFRGDYACLEGISPEMVKRKVDGILASKRGA